VCHHVTKRAFLSRRCGHSVIVIKGVTKLHETVLRLPEVPVSVYTALQDRWWLFKNEPPKQSFGST